MVQVIPPGEGARTPSNFAQFESLTCCCYTYYASAFTRVYHFQTNELDKFYGKGLNPQTHTF